MAFGRAGFPVVLQKWLCISRCDMLNFAGYSVGKRKLSWHKWLGIALNFHAMCLVFPTAMCAVCAAVGRFRSVVGSRGRLTAAEIQVKGFGWLVLPLSGWFGSYRLGFENSRSGRVTGIWWRELRRWLR